MSNQQAGGATAAVALGAPSLEATEQQKRLAISLISGCHTLNHLQYSITSVIFPVIMKELGFGLLQLGMLLAISNFVGQGLQVIYGFFAGFFKRTVVLVLGQCNRGPLGHVAIFRRQLSSAFGDAGGHRCLARTRSIPSVPVSCLAIFPKHVAGH